MSKLQNKVAVVTGASKGIGAAIARAYADEGASVVVNYASDRAGAERVVKEIAAKGGKAIAVQADLGKPDDVTRLFEVTKESFGRLDVLVNNAGVYAFQPLADANLQEFRRQFDINVLGPLLAAQQAAKLFGDDGGSIINVGSVVSQKALAGASIYASTKAALEAQTRVLSAELAQRKIRVNLIAPGGVVTEGAISAGVIGSDFEKAIVARTAMGRLGQPEDIAGLAVFLGSDASAWITGERIAASGGFE